MNTENNEVEKKNGLENAYVTKKEFDLIVQDLQNQIRQLELKIELKKL